MSTTNPTGVLPWIPIRNAAAHAGTAVELRG